jgi:hypothetical protein
MNAKQLAEMFKAQDCARMLTGQDQPRQEAFVTPSGDVDWDRYDESWPSTTLAVRKWSI